MKTDLLLSTINDLQNNGQLKPENKTWLLTGLLSFIEEGTPLAKALDLSGQRGHNSIIKQIQLNKRDKALQLAYKQIAGKYNRERLEKLSSVIKSYKLNGVSEKPSSELHRQILIALSCNCHIPESIAHLDRIVNPFPKVL